MFKVIKSKADHEAALALIDRLIALDPEPGTPEADELEVLTVLVKDLESVQFPIQVPDPVEAIEFRMEQLGLGQRDLAALEAVTRARRAMDAPEIATGLHTEFRAMLADGESCAVVMREFAEWLKSKSRGRQIVFSMRWGEVAE